MPGQGVERSFLGRSAAPSGAAVFFCGFFGARPAGDNLPSMTQKHDYILTVADVAAHFALEPRTIRTHLKSGALPGAKVRGKWMCQWQDVWSAERGPFPKGDRQGLYQKPMRSRRSLAAKLEVHISTVDRYIEEGLPTRNVFGSVRIAPFDAETWLRATYGLSISLEEDEVRTS